MPLLRRARAAAVSAALLATGRLAVAAPAAADPAAADQAGCVDRGPVLRYLVVFDRDTTDQAARALPAGLRGVLTVSSVGAQRLVDALGAVTPAGAAPSR